MYLDNLGAVEAGNTYYAYQKKLAALRESDAPKIVNWKVSPPLQGDVFNSTVDRTGPWSSPSNASIPGLTDVQTLFAMPLVGADVDPTGALASFAHTGSGTIQMQKLRKQPVTTSSFSNFAQAWAAGSVNRQGSLARLSKFAACGGAWRFPRRIASSNKDVF